MFQDLPALNVGMSSGGMHFIKLPTKMEGCASNAVALLKGGAELIQIHKSMECRPIKELDLVFRYPNGWMNGQVMETDGRYLMRNVPTLGMVQTSYDPKERWAMVLGQHRNWVDTLIFHGHPSDDRLTHHQYWAEVKVRPAPSEQTLEVFVTCP